LALNPVGTRHDHFEVAEENVGTLGAVQTKVGFCAAGLDSEPTGTKPDQAAFGSVGLGTLPDQRRKEIDLKYDYRYSQLDLVFGRLLREKWIDEEDLRTLGEEKLEAIRTYAKFFAGMDPA